MLCVDVKKNKYTAYDSFENNEDHSDDFLKEMKISALKNLYIRAHKEYEVFRTMVNANSYDQETLDDEKAGYFKQKLKMRI
jgi:hypothetical protein